MKNLLKNLKEFKFNEILPKIKEWVLNLSKKQVIIFAVVVVAFVGVYKSHIIKDKFFASKAVVKQNTTAAKKGNLKVVVSGSGPIYFTNSNKIYSKIGANVKKVNYKEGDSVKAGDVIYELDSTDAQTALNTDLNSYKQNQISATTSNDAVNNLSVTAPFAGLVSDILVKEGDTVQKGTTVFTIADISKLKVLLTYNSSAAGKIAVGQTAKVYLTSLMQSVSGKVTYISNETTGTTVGGKLYTVEIQITNPGSVLEGMTASADIAATGGTISSTGTAELNYIKKQLVTSITGGTVENVAVKQNQTVSSGQVLVTMSSADIARAKENSDLQLENAQATVALKTKQLDNYKIIAPIDGVITKMSNKVGDTLKAGDELSDVSDPKQMEFDIPVDELDIAKLKVGQKTSISVDALPATTKTPVTGVVGKIAVTGVSESGVTTFVVTIKINDNLGILKGGMNANGEIEVSNKDNILYVPIEAITTVNDKSYVYIKTAGVRSSADGAMGGQPGEDTTTTGSSKESAAKVTTKITQDAKSARAKAKATDKTSGKASTKVNYYDGSTKTQVEVGANNDTYIEITSGVKEGDVIVLPQTQAASTTKSTTKSATKTKSSGAGGSSGGGAPGGGGF
ncbi:efflux RND transporter periplasmic adaptor subunit [Clostridium estertheticum]|uniref:Efflux RND transporter periplasmic adaptor subunit n=1 Tax=Clostridium estertheticum TaxID=238834 RepID=A0AA47EHR1_9CLOT|nr:efflux RND transporter periplasmic adaptor subunit [Clostridium estertheticum]MBU3155375.1 efflux RND transporter periplasmic adaptor subunit [Clostridium estertheticum]WAG60436.1 efflux RND transporter periplasmic adaptor subunit [Clostridium estertheticum]